jgi:hypothetical protein
MRRVRQLPDIARELSVPMSGRRDNDDLSPGQIAIRAFHCCALTASIAIITFLVIRLIVGTG